MAMTVMAILFRARWRRTDGVSVRYASCDILSYFEFNFTQFYVIQTYRIST